MFLISWGSPSFVEDEACVVLRNRPQAPGLASAFQGGFWGDGEAGTFHLWTWDTCIQELQGDHFRRNLFLGSKNQVSLDLTWFDLKALSCPFPPQGRNLAFQSPQSCRNPCEYFVLTGNVLEEENDNDCKHQLEDPHGCTWVEVLPRGGVKGREEMEKREIPDLYCPGWRGCVTLQEQRELCRSQMRFNMTANSCTGMWPLLDIPCYGGKKIEKKRKKAGFCQQIVLSTGESATAAAGDRMLGLTQSGSSCVCRLEHVMLKSCPSVCSIKAFFFPFISISQSLCLALTKSSVKKSRVSSSALPNTQNWLENHGILKNQRSVFISQLLGCKETICQGSVYNRQ